MWKPDLSVLDGVRAKAHAALDKLPGAVGSKLRGLNDALGRPLADDRELADRRAFAEKTAPASAPVPAAAPAAPAAPAKVAAPVIVYHMDKTRRDALKLVEILDAHGIAHTVTNIQEDPAAQFAVRRDSHSFRLPVVFVAGECIGGREQLINLASSGELKKTLLG